MKNSKFGFLVRLNFLQNLLSHFLSRINPAVMHNVEKYIALKKVCYLSAIENISGDYLEFGVFTGSSFTHAMRCFNAMEHYNPTILKTCFHGFDSFEGFGSLSENEKHLFYTDQNFTTDYNKVVARANSARKKLSFTLHKGFFSETLREGPESLGIKKSRIIFIDSDTYSSASDALNFSISTMQQGTYLIFDDFYSYRGSWNQGVAKAFRELAKSQKIKTRKVFNYGMGGVVYVIESLRV